MLAPYVHTRTLAHTNLLVCACARTYTQARKGNGPKKYKDSGPGTRFRDVVREVRNAQQVVNSNKVVKKKSEEDVKPWG